MLPDVKQPVEACYFEDFLHFALHVSQYHASTFGGTLSSAVEYHEGPCYIYNPTGRNSVRYACRHCPSGGSCLPLGVCVVNHVGHPFLNGKVERLERFFVDIVFAAY